MLRQSHTRVPWQQHDSTVRANPSAASLARTFSGVVSIRLADSALRNSFADRALIGSVRAGRLVSGAVFYSFVGPTSPQLATNPTMLKRLAVLISMSAAPLLAQAPANPNVANARMLWEQVSGYIAQSAADAPEAMYAYKPTPEVRSFGELLGHIAGSEKMFCAIALGEKPPAEDAVEKAAKTKAALVAALKDADHLLRARVQADRQGDGADGRPLRRNSAHGSSSCSRTRRTTTSIMATSSRTCG